jgi:hypothetical protein
VVVAITGKVRGGRTLTCIKTLPAESVKLAVEDLEGCVF